MAAKLRINELKDCSKREFLCSYTEKSQFVAVGDVNLVNTMERRHMNNILRTDLNLFWGPGSIVISWLRVWILLNDSISFKIIFPRGRRLNTTKSIQQISIVSMYRGRNTRWSGEGRGRRGVR